MTEVEPRAQHPLAALMRWHRQRHPFGEAAVLGVALAITLTAADLIGRALGAPPQSLFERAHLRLLGSWTHLVGVGVSVARAPWLLLPLLLPAALLAAPKTRAATLAVLAVAGEIVGAWLSAILVGTCLALGPWQGLLATLVALPVAALLARIPRWSVSAMTIMTAGLILGAGVSVLFNDDTLAVTNVETRYLSCAGAALVLALGLVFVTRARAPRSWRRLAELWGLCAVSLVSMLVAVLVGIQLHRVRFDTTHQFIGDWAYDLLVTGDPPLLIWTDKSRVRVLTDPYGKVHDRYELPDTVHFPQRIWPSPTQGFYVQTIHAVDWWPTPQGPARITPDPPRRYVKPADFGNGPPWAFAEDSLRHTGFMTSEFWSNFVAMDLEGGGPRANGQLSRSFWPAMHATPDAAARVLYLSGCVGDGDLFVLNLDTWQVVGHAPSLFAYETVLDPQRHLLWGARPLAGDVVALDTKSLEVRQRIPVAFGTRELTRDPRSGDLYTCGFVSGEVYRLDARSGSAIGMGRCGEACRNLYLDVARDTLWVATRDRICRMPAPARH